MIRFQCPQCGKKLKAGQKQVGRQFKCAGCKSDVMVPRHANDSSSNSVDDGAVISSSGAPSEASPETKGNKAKGSKAKGNKAKGNKAEVRKSNQSSATRSQSAGHLFGQSANVSNSDQNVGREFQLKENSSNNSRRWFLAIGALLGLIVASAIAYGVIKQKYSVPKFEAEFEALAEVEFYRRIHGQLVQTGRQMSVMAKAFKVKNSSAGDFSEQHKRLTSSIENYTNNSQPLLRQAATLIAQGQENRAKSLLVETGKEMKSLIVQIEREVGEFNKKTHW